MLYEVISYKSVNKFEKGDKYDASVEATIKNSVEDVFIVKKTKSGYMVSIAKEYVVPVQEPVKEKVKEPKHDTPIIPSPPRSGRKESPSRNRNTGKGKRSKY